MSFLEIPTLSYWQWILGAFCAFSIGVAKTGVPGFGILVVPLMVLAVGDARQSAGWLLPILCTADAFALYFWRRHSEVTRLFSLVPWVVVGMAGGALALSLPERSLRPVVGGVVLVMVLAHLYRRWKENSLPAATAPYGVAAGFATTVANAAGPVMNLYLLSKRLPKEEFIATGAWFFFIINLSKIPIYAYHRLFSKPSVTFDFLMIPAVLFGALTGRWLLARIPQRTFEVVTIALAAVSALLLFR